ncbi:MAG: PilZ domain-containing protein [Phycisphaerales bacterium]|nr:PilZ domain-containing protein [Phycisphaerales bacterium]
MPFDRRRFSRREPGRRSAFRSYMALDALWRSAAGNSRGACQLIEASESGLAVMGRSASVPTIGSVFRLHVNGKTWRRQAEVVRIDPVADGRVLVAAEFINT